MNARNLVRFGTWSTDDWHLYLVNLPFSILEAISFRLLGIGIVQARFVSILATVATTTLLAVGLRAPFGRLPATLAAVSFAGSTLVLFYGRLALLEPLVATGLTLAAVLVSRAGNARAGRYGLLAGLALALAIGVKPNAAFASLGILLGVAIVAGRRDVAVRRWLGGAIAAVAACAAAWLVVVLIPRASEVAADVRIWPAQHLPPRSAISSTRSPTTHSAPTARSRQRWCSGLQALPVWPHRSPVGATSTRAVGGWLGRPPAGSSSARCRCSASITTRTDTSCHCCRHCPCSLRPGWPSPGRCSADPGRAPAWRRWHSSRVLVLPGLAAYVGWLSGGTRELAPAQAAYDRILPRDRRSRANSRRSWR